MAHINLTIETKFNKVNHTSFKYTEEGKIYTFNFRENIFIPAGSKITFEIPEHDFFYSVKDLKGSIFIDQVKYYSDIKVIDYPSNVEFNRSKWL